MAAPVPAAAPPGPPDPGGEDHGAAARGAAPRPSPRDRSGLGGPLVPATARLVRPPPGIGGAGGAARRPDNSTAVGYTPGGSPVYSMSTC